MTDAGGISIFRRNQN